MTCGNDVRFDSQHPRVKFYWHTATLVGSHIVSGHLSAHSTEPAAGTDTVQSARPKHPPAGPSHERQAQPSFTQKRGRGRFADFSQSVARLWVWGLLRAERLCHLHIDMVKLRPQSDGVRRSGLWEVMGPSGWSLTHGVSAQIGGTPASCSPLHPVRTQWGDGRL